MALYTRNVTQTSFMVEWTSHGSSVAEYNVEIYLGYVGNGSPIRADRGLSSSTFSRTYSGFEPNTTYGIKLYSRNSNNVTIQIENASVTTLSNRPQNWQWYTPKVSGQWFYVSASEWNAFCSRINEFRRYKGLHTYTFSMAISESRAYAHQINEAISAIDPMVHTSPTMVTKGGTAYAYTMNQLRDSLNSIT